MVQTIITIVGGESRGKKGKGKGKRKGKGKEEANEERANLIFNSYPRLRCEMGNTRDNLARNPSGRFKGAKDEANILVVSDCQRLAGKLNEYVRERVR